ncbi:MAG: chemotaxis protein CheC [Actinobacteria bacterium]|nr:chemotaxis protein CheC [Actinomycetota bacterium]
MSKMIGSLTLKQRELLERILKLSADSSAVALSEMTDKSIFLKSPEIDVVPLGDVPAIAGGNENPAVSVCLLLLGEARGNILLVFPGRSAFKLADLVLQEDSGDTEELSEMAVSVLGEVGNLVSAYFLSTLSDYTGLRIQPSAPMIVHDMVEAIVSSAMLILEEAPDEILYIETNIADESDTIQGYMMLFTDEATLHSILQAMEAR